jgi:hypothetical protein
MNTETATQNWSKEYNYHREVVHVEEETHRRVPVGLQWFMTLMAGRTTTDYTMEVNLPDYGHLREHPWHFQDAAGKSGSVLCIL